MCACMWWMWVSVYGGGCVGIESDVKMIGLVSLPMEPVKLYKDT